MIDPRTVVVMIPTYSQRIVAEAVGSLIASSRFFSAVSFTGGVAHVSMARNIVAEKFLRSSAEWLVTIDDDIAFTPNDFSILMEPCALSPATIELETPSRVACPLIEMNGSGEPVQQTSPPAGYSRVMGAADMIVCAEYSYKTDDLIPCRMGLGFTRIHRSVFEKLSAMTHADGTARLWQSMYQGRMITDYFPSGPILSMMVPGAPWTGEDHGFFMICKLAGIVPRIETRTRLFHIGPKAFPYHGGNDGGGQ